MVCLNSSVSLPAPSPAMTWHLAAPCHREKKGFTIKELVDTLIQIIDKSCEVIWDKSKPTGDRKRIMDTQRARNELNFIPATSLTEGLEKTVNWFLKNHKNYSDKYNSFLEKI